MVNKQQLYVLAARPRAQTLVAGFATSKVK